MDDLMNQVNGTEEIVVVTKSGQPRVAVVDPEYLGKLVQYQKMRRLLDKASSYFEDYLRKDLKMSEKQIKKLDDEQAMKLLGLTY